MTSERRATRRGRIWWLATLLPILGAAAWLWAADRGNPPPEPDEAPDPATLHPVHIRTPDGPPMVDTGLKDPHGQPIRVSCGTCHATRPASSEPRLGVPLQHFHQHVKGNHGNLSCLSCHNASDGYQSLRLADGRSVPFSEVMTLCAQCHGPQHRDYLHGAHGGMAGYWDLKRGPRVRNNCIDCHPPHQPRYPMVRPARGPLDTHGPATSRENAR